MFHMPMPALCALGVANEGSEGWPREKKLAGDARVDGQSERLGIWLPEPFIAAPRGRRARIMAGVLIAMGRRRLACGRPLSWRRVAYPLLFNRALGQWRRLIARASAEADEHSERYQYSKKTSHDLSNRNCCQAAFITISIYASTSFFRNV